MSILRSRLHEVADSYFDFDSLALDRSSYSTKLALARGLYDSCPLKVATLDGSDAEVPRIQEWLRSVPLFGNVFALWIDFREGIECDYDRFVSRYDDLWYPSSDDVWIVNPDVTVLLELDHEEIFSWIKAE